MIIKYTGLKPRKIVSIFGAEYTFEPTHEFNEVFDLSAIKWLLHPERAGLFVVVKTTDKTPSATQSHLSQPKEEEPPKEKLEQAAKEPKKSEEEIKQEQQVEEKKKDAQAKKPSKPRKPKEKGKSKKKR